MVTKTIITESLKELGVKNGDVLLFHSSLKSFGFVEGGADAVIDGVLDAVLPNGTAVVPTLVQKNFYDAYKTWDKNTSPSDVGIITETFRLRKNALRSDQATHSVAAIGKHAKEITSTHVSSTPRPHAYGEYAFSTGSPWQKIYELDGKILFIGVDLQVNTFKHFVEALYAERIISLLDNSPKKDELLKLLVTHSTLGEHARQLQEEKNGGKKHTLIRFQFGKLVTDQNFPKACELKKVFCGSSLFTLINARDFVDGLLELVINNPENYYCEDVLTWIEKVKESKTL